MRVKLKTLKNVVVELDLSPDTAVQKVKEEGAASKHGKSEGWDAEGMKLIYQGKIMDNAKELASYGVKEDEFMVVMISKPKKSAASEAPAAEVATPDVLAPEPAAAPAPSAPFLPDHEASINNLCDMGFPRDSVIAAMRAAFMNADRAVEYLTNGIPDQLVTQVGGGPPTDVEDKEGAISETSSTWEQLAASPAFRAEIANIRDQTQLQHYLANLKNTDPEKLALIQGNAQAFAEILNQTPAVSTAEPAPAAAPLPFGAAGGGGGGGGLPAGLSAALVQNPAMLEGLLQNPELLRQLMQSPEVQEMLQTPEAMAQLGINPEMLQAMMGGRGGGMMQIELTVEDEEAINRLMALGFPRGAAIQAFLACDKDENIAANFLFDQGNDLE